MSNLSRRASESLDIIVIGGATAGLACAYAMQVAGHKVRVLEKACGPRTHAAGGDLSPPNMTRILDRWGLSAYLSRVAPKLRGVHFKMSTNGETMRTSLFPEDIMRGFGAEYVFLAYSDLLGALYDLASKAGVVFQYKATVVSIDPEKASAQLASGEVIEGDLLIAADGVHSLARSLISQSIPYGSYGRLHHFCQASSSISADIIRENIELAPLFNSTELNIWMGDGYGITGYPIVSDGEVRINRSDVFRHGGLNNAQEEEISIHATGLKLHELDVRLRALVSLPKVLIKRVYVPQGPLGNLVHESGKVILVGGAAHPLPAHWTQSTAIAIEDAATLEILFSHLSSRDQLPALVSAFEEIRLPRSKSVVESEIPKLEAVVLNHSGTRAMQAARADPHLSTASSKPLTGWDSDLEDTLRAEWEELIAMFDYDASEMAEDWWVTWGALMRSRMEDDSLGNATEKTVVTRQPSVTQRTLHQAIPAVGDAHSSSQDR
ncbi:FAD/NAD(P)-binding domain-containing protein [Neolentinus lepideus HHB14362 ss-1]|uniref:FAD/NAD(P)-binding domain-containing protein n=1 Tax=Neolentinus lepideus HHB14362 ss-1 TaxID=1314782 RepID=A0A165SZ37_9AGAM|nr:FAD/NAD(P)-binding domain-containing protein [Neolentinus lepideus HHB14362 ss-1]